MKKILIAYDGSPGADLAVKDLVRGGLPSRAEVKVLTIADVWLPPTPPEGESVVPLHPGVAKARERAAEVLRTAKQTAIQGAQLVHQVFPGWNVSNTAKADSPAWGILSEASSWRADLVVIGSHGRTPLEKFFIGSVSYKVAAEASCSVRVARPRAHSGNPSAHILIGVDGSGDSARAVDEVLQRRWGSGTQIEVVTVMDAKLKRRALVTTEPFGNPAAMDRIEDSIASLLDATRAKFASRDLKVLCHAFEDDPKTALLRHAADWNVDCIFLGARGLDHGDQPYIGTLASAVCMRAHCTVEIVRATREDQAEVGANP